MYTDEDLNEAVEQGVFTKESVHKFRDLKASIQSSPSVDEENVRLIGGFNDIFIVIACMLLLFSSWWFIKSSTGFEGLGLIVFSIISWFLSEFFVRKRKMALPAIVLLVAFIGSVFTAISTIAPGPDELAIMLAAGGSILAAYCHWRRFSVPITIAAGTAVTIAFLIAVIMYFFPQEIDSLLLILLPFGAITFSLAMYWDAADTDRITGKSDVAFWLHLLSAPMIIHPLFASLGILEGNESLVIMAVVIVLYLLMTIVSVVIDRRAFMVSSLAYVLYALSNVLESFGGIGYSLALTGLFMGSALLLLSAYWHDVRLKLVNLLPKKLQQFVPRVNATSYSNETIA